MAQVRTAALRLLAGGLVALLAAGCSELSPPQPTLDVQVSPQSEVQVEAAGTYTVGNLVVRGANLPANTASVSVSVSLVSPPQGVALVSPLTLPISSTPTTQELRLSLNPSLIFSPGETKKDLSLTLELKVPGMKPVTRPFALTLRRSGGGSGGGSGESFVYELSVDLDKTSVSPGDTFTLTATLTRDQGSGTVQVTPVLPQGFTATPASQQVALSESAPTGKATFQVRVDSGVAAGSYFIGAKGVASGGNPVSDRKTVNVVVPSLALTLAQNTLSLRPGESGSLEVFVSTSGLSGKVALEVSGLPAGVKVTLPKPFAVGASIVSKTLSFAVDPSSVAEGTYTLTVKAKAVDRPTARATASFDLVLAPRPKLATSVSLNRFGVFPGETLSGTVTVTSRGGLSGTVAVQVSACSYPASAISYASSPYETLPPNGTFSVNFTITVPDDAPIGLCQVQATATLNEHTATGQAQFDVLPRPEVQVNVPSEVIAIAGTNSIPVNFSIRLVGTWNGLATLQIFNEDLNPINAFSTTPTYEVRGVHTSPVKPNSFGYTYFPLSKSVEGLLVLSMSEGSGWAEGEYTYRLVLDGPNRVVVPFTVKVLPPRPLPQ